ncbi:MAG TPA: NADH-quinone oxidoreductase subunit NuoE [Syntrophales bacterium]|nr:NADH-quinone oxidoreductase subunit NuoE [Syntrophales bacterium]
MLTEEEKKEIMTEIAQSERPQAACLEALKIAQKYRGWVSDEGIRELAPLLGMTPDELDAVATFYPFIFRRPVGRHVIYLCDTVSCWIMGYETMLDHLTKRLRITMGETTADGRFTLLPVSCIGACDHAPAMMVDQELHGDLTLEKIDSILDHYK